MNIRGTGGNIRSVKQARSANIGVTAIGRASSIIRGSAVKWVDGYDFGYRRIAGAGSSVRGAPSQSSPAYIRKEGREL